MFELELFAGFAVDALFADKLDLVNPIVKTQFIGDNNENYLIDIVHNEIRFLGKSLGKIVSLTQLDLIEANIYSLLKKMVPDFTYDETSLYIFPYSKK